MRSNKERIKEARAEVHKKAEEKKAQMAQLAAKQKGKAKKGKKQEDAPAEEEEKKEEQKTLISEDADLNLNDPEDFSKALMKEVPRPFTFGSIEFNELNLTEDEKKFDSEAARAKIIEALDLHMEQPSCCIRGFNIKIKGRNFKRRSTMLKHGRWMQNLEVSPVYPKIIEEDEDNIDRGDEEAANSDE